MSKRGPQAATDWQLFHLGDDPKEQRDLATGQPDVLADMHRRYLAQRARDKPNPKRR